jgi:hypothetical protein
MKWGGDLRAYYGEAARFEPINLVFNSVMTANSTDTPDIVNTGNQWASFMLGGLDNRNSSGGLDKSDAVRYAMVNETEVAEAVETSTGRSGSEFATRDRAAQSGKRASSASVVGT